MEALLVTVQYEIIRILMMWQKDQGLELVDSICLNCSFAAYCAFYCGFRDPVSAERLACHATIAISGESTPS